MPTIGLTGGYASGKSMVSAIFAGAGGKIIDCDQIAREMVEPESAGLAKVIENFGAEILSPDGSLNRYALAQIIFADENKRRSLEGLLHPLIRHEVFLRAEIFFKSNRNAMVVVEAPLLFEGGLYRQMSTNVLVTCHRDQQVKRGMKRDSVTATEADLRIDAQWPLNKKEKLADYLIDNSGDREETRAVAMTVWRSISQNM